MQLGKILAAGTMGLLMAGSTLAFAATLADYPQPFLTSDGAADFLVVVGASAMPADVVGSIDVATRLGSEAYTSYNCPGSSGATTVTGEGAAVATTNMKAYLNDYLKKDGLRYTFTKTELPTVLKSGTIEDSTLSTTYDYNQYIELSDDYTVQFAQYRPSSGTTQDPALVLLEANGANPSTASTSTYVYKEKVVFEKEVNGTTTVGETMSLFGKTYTISSTTTFTASSPKLVLYGSADTKVLTEKEKVTVTVAGNAYDVTLGGVSDADTIVVTVGTDTKSIDKLQTKTIGGLQVYVDDVYYYGSTRTDNQAKVSFGASTLTLEEGKKAYTTVGGTSTNIDGTYVDLTASDGKLTMVEIYVVGPKSTVDVVKEGDAFTDPIFGTFKLDFASATPDLMSSVKSTLDVKASGDDQLTATFMDYRGNTKTITWAYNADSIDLEDSGGYKYVVVEGQDIAENQYFITDAGGYSHLFQLSSLDNDGSATGSLELTDIFSGTTYSVLMGLDNQSTKVIDGQTYYIKGNTTHVKVTWGTTSNYQDVGAELTVWPIIPGTKGERYALAENPSTLTGITNGKYMILPTGVVLATAWSTVTGTVYLNLTAYTGYTASGCTNFNISSSASSCALKLGKSATGGAYYNITGTGTNTSITIKPAGSTTVAYNEEAIAIVEEADSLSNAYSVWVQASNETSGSIVQIMAGAPDFTYTDRDSVAMKTDTYKTQYVDVYGVFAERNTYGQDSVKLWYPDEQTTMDFFILGPDGAVSTQGAVTGGTVKQQTSVKTAVAKLDSDVTDADKNNDNIILVGGPAVNTLVVDLATAGKTKDLSWYLSQGEGTAIIDFIADAWGTGKAALVVAGYSAADTKAVTGILLGYDSHASDLTGTRAIFKNGVLSTETA